MKFAIFPGLNTYRCHLFDFISYSTTFNTLTHNSPFLQSMSNVRKIGLLWADALLFNLVIQKCLLDN